MRRKSAKEKGFTLMELLVAMAIVSILGAAIMTTYHMQLKSHVAQVEMVELQQNLRAAMQLIARDIRMAGYDPSDSTNAGFETMLANRIRFTKDTSGGEADGLDNDGDGNTDEADEARFPDGDLDDVEEDIEYAINVADTSLGRQIGGAGGLQPLVPDIEAVNFVYLDASRSPTASPAAVKIVQVTLVGRTAHDRQGNVRIPDNMAYRNMQGTVIFQAPGDFFRRMVISEEVYCRNL